MHAPHHVLFRPPSPDELAAHTPRRGPRPHRFPIQAATIPDALAGRDVLGRGRTGSGKTLAFGLPLLARPPRQRAGPRAAAAPWSSCRPASWPCRSPTRSRRYARSLRPVADAPSSAACRTTGRSSALRRGVDVLVATPGRLERPDRAAALPTWTEVEITVLDEADQMADMGFLPAGHRAARPGRRPDGQRLLFSATLDRDVDRWSSATCTDPVDALGRPGRRRRSPRWSTTCCMSRRATSHAIDRRDRRPRAAARSCSCDTQLGVDRLAEQLLASGRPAPRRCTAAMTQRARTRTLGRVQGRPRRPCWSPPTSPPAASTSTTSTSSCTSTRRPTTRTTCTAPAAPRAPAVRHRRHPGPAAPGQADAKAAPRRGPVRTSRQRPPGRRRPSRRVRRA